jgi:glucose-6-phosphate 1-epimerase
MQVMPVVALLLFSPAGWGQTTDLSAAKRLADLNARFALPGGELKFIAGQGGLLCAEINTAACTGRIYLQGAHVAAWQPAGEAPVIFMSSKSDFAEGKAFRGGVPVCFPWFAAKADDPAAPFHGVVRTAQWDVVSTKPLPGAEVSVVMKTHSDEATRRYYPHDFEIENHVTFGKQLRMELVVTNGGNAPMSFSDAQHNYFRVGAIDQVAVAGLDGVEYIDKVDNGQRKKQTGEISFDNQVDRVYLNTRSPLTITDRSLKRKILVEKQGSSTTVVWNPGQERARGIADLGANDWPHMLCVEAANLMDSEIILPPGDMHHLTTVVTVAH